MIYFLLNLLYFYYPQQTLKQRSFKSIEIQQMKKQWLKQTIKDMIKEQDSMKLRKSIQKNDEQAIAQKNYSSMKCIGQNQGIYFCTNDQCKQKQCFICQITKCPCQNSHRCCQKEIIEKIFQLMKQKIYKTDDINSKVLEIFKSIMDSLSQFQNEILQKIKCTIEYLSLSEIEKKFYLAVEQQSFYQFSREDLQIVLSLSSFKSQNDKKIFSQITEKIQSLQTQIFAINTTALKQIQEILARYKQISSKLQILNLKESKKQKLQKYKKDLQIIETEWKNEVQKNIEKQCRRILQKQLEQIKEKFNQKNQKQKKLASIIQNQQKEINRLQKMKENSPNQKLQKLQAQQFVFQKKNFLDNKEYLKKIWKTEQRINQQYQIQKTKNGDNFYSLNHSQRIVKMQIFLKYDWSKLIIIGLNDCSIYDDGWSQFAMNGVKFDNLQQIQITNNKIRTVTSSQLQSFISLKQIWFYHPQCENRYKLSEQSKKVLKQYNKKNNPYKWAIACQLDSNKREEVNNKRQLQLVHLATVKESL